jgi:tetratricopeptide (TPR) repeat protein
MKGLGEHHETTLVTEAALGNLLWQLDRPAEAAPLLESACNKTEAKHGEDYPELLSMRNNLGFVYQAAGDTGKALSTFKEVLEAKIRVLGEMNLGTAVGHHAVASQLRNMKRPGDALPYHEKAVAIAESLAGEEDSRGYIFTAALGSSLLDLGRSAEAASRLAAGHAGLARILGDDHPRTRQVGETLAKALEALGDAEAAARLRAPADSTAGVSRP